MPSCVLWILTFSSHPTLFYLHQATKVGWKFKKILNNFRVIFFFLLLKVDKTKVTFIAPDQVCPVTWSSWLNIHSCNMRQFDQRASLNVYQSSSDLLTSSQLSCSVSRLKSWMVALFSQHLCLIDLTSINLVPVGFQNLTFISLYRLHCLSRPHSSDNCFIIDYLRWRSAGARDQSELLVLQK